MENQTEDHQVPSVNYAGFWLRVVASLIDSLLMLMVLTPILFIFFGNAFWMSGLVGMGGFVVNYLLPALVVILFWVYKSATPGKMLLKLRIVDAATGGKPTSGQLIGRYAAYYVSMLPLLLGFFWVAFDRRKQGWHDKLAGTLVIEDTPNR
jgi:uncharacterized RDD family membrane protein YckC